MLLDPPRLKPPPPRPPPPPPRPPRASTSWIMKAVRPTKALSIARLWIVLRILLSRTLVGRHLNPLCISIRDERELSILVCRIQLPVHAGGECRPGRIGAVDDDQPARPGLIALLHPDFPVHVRLAEGEMVGLR